MLTNIEQMEANVAKFKHDIDLSTKQYEADRVKITISLIVAAAACLGAGAAVMNYLDRHYTPNATQSQGKL
jgi:hypothetical protein